MFHIILKIYTTFCLMIQCNVLGTCYEIKTVTAPQKGNGLKSIDGPQWSVQENALYWVSNFGEKKLFRMDGKTGKITSRNVCYGSPSLIVPVRNYPGYVVVAIRSILFLLKWGASGGDAALKLLSVVDVGKPDNNINDGKADAFGRLYFGTFGKIDFNLPTLVPLDQATLYSINKCNYAKPLIIIRPVSLSNGIAWSLDNKKMYYNDSPTRKIVAYDYNLEKGEIANKTVIFSFAKCNVSGIPDGMTIDKDGNLWVATFDGGVVLQIDPFSGNLLRQIPLPVDQVSSVMWGGPRLDRLYVPTAALNVKKPKPLSSSMFVLEDLGTRGVPENQVKFPNADKY